MATFTITPNMSLTNPTPSTGVTGSGEPGPLYATDISGDLVLIDAHDHSSGKGVQITPQGLNINADLAFNQNNALTLRSARFTSQPSGLIGVGDVSSIYVRLGDLWYNNSAGTPVQVTAGGAISSPSP